MNIQISKFREWLLSKNLSQRTIQNYLFYFKKFYYEVFNQETVNKFLAFPGHRNTVGRAFLLNYQKFLVVNFHELGIPQEFKLGIVEVELPKITGRTRQRIIRVIEHDQIPLLEEKLDTEKERLQLLLTYYGGLRLGELLKITVMSFNWEVWKRDTEKMGECRVYGKGDKEGIALIPSILMKRIAKYIHDNNFISVGSYLFLPNNKEKIKLNKKRNNGGFHWK